MRIYEAIFCIPSALNTPFNDPWMWSKKVWRNIIIKNVLRIPMISSLFVYALNIK